MYGCIKNDIDMAVNKKIRAWTDMGEKVKMELIERATILGKEAMEYAYEKGYSSTPRSMTSLKYMSGDRDAWTDVKGNLRDSFVSAVYVGGTLIKDSVRYLESNPTGKHGRKAADEFINSIHPFAKKDEITIVVAAAELYAQYLESGRHRGGYKIRVISGAKDYINAHYKEMVEGVYKRWNIKKPLYKVVRGNIRDPYYDYIAPGKGILSQG